MGRRIAAGLLVSVMLGLALAGCGGDSSARRKPGEAEFREANRRIIRLEGKATQGNCPQAEQLAADFGKAITELRAAAIEKGREDRLSLSHGQMLVFCELTDTHCAFLVHVPELRKFTREAKDVMTAICWNSAQTTLRAKQIKRDHLAVGMKGVMLYESILVGKTTDDPADSDDGIEERTDEMSSFYPFFVGSPPAATTVTVATKLPSAPVAPASVPAKSQPAPVAKAPERKPAAPAPAPRPAAPPPIPVHPLDGRLSAEFGKPTTIARPTYIKYPWTNPGDRMYRIYTGDMRAYEFGDLTVRAIYSGKAPVLFSLMAAKRKLTAEEIAAAKRVMMQEDPRGEPDAFVEKDGSLLTLVPVAGGALSHH